MNDKQLLKQLLAEKEKRIKELESKLDAKAQLTYANSILNFIDTEFLTIYSPIKLLMLYYLKGFLAVILKSSNFSVDNINKLLANYYLCWILCTIYITYISYKYLKSRREAFK